MKHAAQDVIGSWIVFDPTGRDMAECMEAGQIVSCYFSADDDGDNHGHPRPLMGVRAFGQVAADIAVTTVHAVYPTQSEAFAAAEGHRVAATIVRLGRQLAGITEHVETLRTDEFGRALESLHLAGDYIDTAIGSLIPGEFHVSPEPMETAKQKPGPMEHLAEIATLASLARTALDDPAALPDGDMTPGYGALGEPMTGYAIDRLDDIIQRARDAGAIND